MSLKFGTGSEYLSHCALLNSVTAQVCCHLQYGSGRKAREVQGVGFGGQVVGGDSRELPEFYKQACLVPGQSLRRGQEGRVTPVTCLPAPTLLIRFLIFFLISHYY